MNEDFWICLYNGSDKITAQASCTGLTLEREAYTPYDSLTAVFRTNVWKTDTNITKVILYKGEEAVYEGLADNVEQVRQEGADYLRVKSRSYTSMMVQNELPGGLHANLTMTGLMTGFYTLPGVDYENYGGTGYIFVREGTTLWDSVVNYGFKLSGNHPYVLDNCVRLTPHASPKRTVLADFQVISCGTGRELSHLIRKYHMENIEGDTDGYVLEDELAAQANIVRHKYLGMDQQYLYAPMQALDFRKKYAQRFCRYKFVEYGGFRNERICDHVSFGTFLPESRIGRVRMTFGKNGLRTKIWAYDDGFYHIGELS